jgi:hypothetical protein
LRARYAEEKSMEKTIEIILYAVIVIECFGGLYFAAHPEKLYRKGKKEGGK